MQARNSGSVVRYTFAAVFLLLLVLSCTVVGTAIRLKNGLPPFGFFDQLNSVYYSDSPAKFFEASSDNFMRYPIILGLLASSIALVASCQGLFVAVMRWPGGLKLYPRTLFTIILSSLAATAVISVAATLATFVAHYTSPAIDLENFRNAPQNTYVFLGAYETGSWSCQLSKFRWTDSDSSGMLDSQCQYAIAERWMLFLQTITSFCAILVVWFSRTEAIRLGLEAQERVKHENGLYLGEDMYN